MICNACKKTNATVFLSEIVDGSMQNIQLCQKCFDKRNYPKIKPMICSCCGNTPALISLGTGIVFLSKPRALCAKCLAQYHQYVLAEIEKYDTWPKPLLKKIDQSAMRFIKSNKNN